MPNPLQSDFWQTRTPATIIGKQQSKIVIPAGTYTGVDNVGADASVVCAQFNFEAPNNVIIDRSNFAALATLGKTNFIICVRNRYYRASLPTPSFYQNTRYKLFTGASTTAKNTINYPLYNGEILLAKFCVELWTEDTGDMVVASDIVLNLSVTKPKVALSDANTYELVSPTTVLNMRQTSLYNHNALNKFDVPLGFSAAQAGPVAFFDYTL